MAPVVFQQQRLTYNRRVNSACVRLAGREARRLSSSITTDLLGTDLVYYTRLGDAVYTSSSVGALAKLRTRVTINQTALAEAMAFGFVLRDETIFTEVRSIPPHSTLHVDGSITRNVGPQPHRTLLDADQASQMFLGILSDVVAECEESASIHCAGLTGGKDSRILAALPKRFEDAWHWLTISGRGDAEHVGAVATAERLALRNTHWTEWTSDFLADDTYRLSADLANGVGAVSDHSLLRGAFEAYRSVSLPSASATSTSLWIGTLADGLFAATYLPESAPTIAGAVPPRTSHLPQLLAPSVLAHFAEQQAYYASNPFSQDQAPEEATWLIRLFTRGRLYVCRSLSCFGAWPGPQINPFLHPSLIELALSIDRRLLAADAVRDGALRKIGPGLDSPSAFGYKAPAYAHHVFRALAHEVSRAEGLDGLIDDVLLGSMRSGEFPDISNSLRPTAEPTPAYRIHSLEPQSIVRSLRDYEHLLVYVTFLNELRDQGLIVDL